MRKQNSQGGCEGHRADLKDEYLRVADLSPQQSPCSTTPRGFTIRTPLRTTERGKEGEKQT